MIQITNLSKNYGAIEAVKNVSLKIGKGRIVGLLGQNGAGKTTVMKIITGYIEPTGGTVKVAGKDIMENRVEVQKQIGYMPENAPLYPEMLVQEYLLMMASLREIPKDKQKSMILEAVKATGLEKFLTRPIGTLSKGYRQRVGICQAIVHKPEILILDEPTNGLDPVQIVEIRNLIKKLSKNSTVLLSTHILQEIEAVCDRVVILIDGQLAQDSSLDEFLASSTINLSVDSSVTKPELQKLKETVPSLGEVAKKGPDLREGFNKWSIQWDEGPSPIPEILQQAAACNWKIAWITANPPSLEQAFSSLMTEHAQRKREETTV